MMRNTVQPVPIERGVDWVVGTWRPSWHVVLLVMGARDSKEHVARRILACAYRFTTVARALPDPMPFAVASSGVGSFPPAPRRRFDPFSGVASGFLPRGIPPPGK